MTGRVWFYLTSIIIIIGLFSFLLTEKGRVANQLQEINSQASQDQQKELAGYLANQTDDRKLVSLAKRLKQSDPQLLKVIIDRAYEINPNSRDIALLASYFHPELKKKVKELDPLYPIN